MAWVMNEDTGASTWQEDPAPDGMKWERYDGGGEGGYDSRLVADTSKYDQVRSAKGGEILEIFNPDTGVWEPGVYDIANPSIRLPASVAQKLGIRSAPAQGHVAGKGNLLSELISDPNFVQFALAAAGGAYGSGGLDGLFGSGASAGSGTAFAATEAAGDAALGELLTGMGYGEAAAAGAAMGGAQTFPLTDIGAPITQELGATGSIFEGITPEAFTGSGIGELVGGASSQAIPTGLGLGEVGAAAGGLGGISTGFAGAGAAGVNAALGLGSGSVAGDFATPGLLQQIQNGIQDVVNPTPTGSSQTPQTGYQFPWQEAIGSLLGYQQQNDYADKLSEAMKYAADKADPFASQRPFYQGELKSMYTDPNYFNNSALLKGQNANAINDTTRALASQGYNMSGNVPMEVAQRLQNNNMTYALDLMNKTGGYAGAGFGPGAAGTIAAQGGQAAAGAANQGNFALGNMFNSIWNGQQPNGAQQAQGAGTNQNFLQYLFA